jgi:rhodanese-related sulfurtransferase
MEESSLALNVSRRKMLLKIIRVATSKLIKGEYHFPAVPEITADDLHDRIKSGQDPLIIDIRSAQEFGTGYGHIPNSKLVPMMDLVASFNDLDDFKRKVKTLESQLGEILPFKEEEVVTVCPGGGFSLVAAEIMVEAGFRDVKSLSGGSDGWFKKGYPTSRS